MKTTFFLFAISALLLVATMLAADTMQERLNGTWSGTWIPAGGVRDAMTIELKHDDTVDRPIRQSCTDELHEGGI
jgi:hypothetical protein